jgi:hypothetical protein
MDFISQKNVNVTYIKTKVWIIKPYLQKHEAYWWGYPGGKSDLFI